MEVRSESEVHVRSEKVLPLQGQMIQRTRLKVLFVRVCSSILIWTCLVQLIAVWELYNPRLFSGFTSYTTKLSVHVEETLPTPLPLLPASESL